MTLIIESDEVGTRPQGGIVVEQTLTEDSIVRIMDAYQRIYVENGDLPSTPTRNQVIARWMSQFLVAAANKTKSEEERIASITARDAIPDIGNEFRPGRPGQGNNPGQGQGIRP